MNSANIIGRLVKDPDVRTTPNGIHVARFTVAVNRNSEEADFIQVTAFKESADLIDRYVRKGNRIGVSGRIQSESRELADGSRRYYFGIVADRIDLLEPRQQNSQNAYNAPQPAQAQPQRAPVYDDEVGIEDDDLPF